MSRFRTRARPLRADGTAPMRRHAVRPTRRVAASSSGRVRRQRVAAAPHRLAGAARQRPAPSPRRVSTRSPTGGAGSRRDDGSSTSSQSTLMRADAGAPVSCSADRSRAAWVASDETATGGRIVRRDGGSTRRGWPTRTSWSTRRPDGLSDTFAPACRRPPIYTSAAADRLAAGAGRRSAVRPGPVPYAPPPGERLAPRPTWPRPCRRRSRAAPSAARRTPRTASTRTRARGSPPGRRRPSRRGGRPTRSATRGATRARPSGSAAAPSSPPGDRLSSTRTRTPKPTTTAAIGADEGEKAVARSPAGRLRFGLSTRSISAS